MAASFTNQPREKHSNSPVSLFVQHTHRTGWAPTPTTEWRWRTHRGRGGTWPRSNLQPMRREQTRVVSETLTQTLIFIIHIEMMLNVTHRMNAGSEDEVWSSWRRDRRQNVSNLFSVNVWNNHSAASVKHFDRIDPLQLKTHTPPHTHTHTHTAGDDPFWTPMTFDPTDRGCRAHREAETTSTKTITSSPKIKKPKSGRISETESFCTYVWRKEAADRDDGLICFWCVNN